MPDTPSDDTVPDPMSLANARTEWLAAAALPTPDPQLPEWFRELQTRSWRDLVTLPDPKRTDENWRFATLKLSRMDALEPAVAPAESQIAEVLERSEFTPHAAARFVFLNGRPVLTDPGELTGRAGVICLPLREAILTQGELVRAHFMREGAPLGGAKFAALHGAADLDGLFLHVAEGTKVEGAVEIYHWATGENTAVFPHTLIVAEDQADIRVIEYFCSLNPHDATVAVALTDLAAERGGQIEYTALQNWNGHSRHVQINATRVGRDAKARGCFVNLGSRWTRTESLSRMTGTGADSRMLSVNLATGEQEFDQRTLQSHEAERTTSDLLYKNALYDKSRTIFSGLIRVDKGAHFTDAYQTCRNLLGSDEAEANSMPGLEINADEVKCSHGSTSGQISDDEIFYLRARGIPASDARKMITLGFLNQVIDHIEAEEVRDHVHRLVEEKFLNVVE